MCPCASVAKMWLLVPTAPHKNMHYTVILGESQRTQVWVTKFSYRMSRFRYTGCDVCTNLWGNLREVKLANLMSGPVISGLSRSTPSIIVEIFWDTYRVVHIPPSTQRASSPVVFLIYLHLISLILLPSLFAYKPTGALVEAQRIGEFEWCVIVIGDDCALLRDGGRFLWWIFVSFCLYRRVHRLGYYLLTDGVPICFQWFIIFVYRPSSTSDTVYSCEESIRKCVKNV